MPDLTTNLGRVAARTHIGKVRTENQDRVGSFHSSAGEVYVVADGMGGHEGGARAAELAVEWIRSTLTQSKCDGSLPERLRGAIAVANAGIHAEASSDPKLTAMGSTIVIVVIHEGRATIAHVGDSRAYLWRKGELTRLTRDHNVLEPFLETGEITEEEARVHASASVLTKALGPLPEVEPSISDPVILEHGDRILLCTDGLCGYVLDARIEEILNHSATARDAVDRLIALALAAGGEDNIAVQVVVHERPGLASPERVRGHPQDGKQRRPRAPFSGLLLKSYEPSQDQRFDGRKSRVLWAALCLAGASMVYWGWLSRRPDQAAPAKEIIIDVLESPPDRKPAITLVCGPVCPIKGPAALLSADLRADKGVVFNESNGSPMERSAPLVLYRDIQDRERAMRFASALGVIAADTNESVRQQYPTSDILIIVSEK